jgi:hypothetical protein
MHKLGFNDKQDITNFKNHLYYGVLYVGEQYQNMQVIIDTSSDWLILESQECETCQENKYDPNTSAYFSIVATRKFNRDYGSIINTEVI